MLYKKISPQVTLSLAQNLVTSSIPFQVLPILSFSHTVYATPHMPSRAAHKNASVSLVAPPLVICGTRQVIGK